MFKVHDDRIEMVDRTREGTFIFFMCEVTGQAARSTAELQFRQ